MMRTNGNCRSLVTHVDDTLTTLVLCVHNMVPTSLSSPSSSTHEDIDPTHYAGLARKRVRCQAVTCEERKESRAHRNRIAAQNSRDRRKAQFTHLERRVAELEEENRLLRAGVAIPPAAQPAVCSQPDENLVRERENEELRERIRTLEKGWDIVLKALAAQGLVTGLSSPSVSASPPASTTSTPSSSSPPSDACVSVSNSASVTASIPSPAPFQPSFETESTPPNANEVSKGVGSEYTRHLARVASIERPSLVSSVALQRVISLPASTFCHPTSYVRVPQRKRLTNHSSRSPLTSISGIVLGNVVEMRMMRSLWRHFSEKLSLCPVRGDIRKGKAAKYLLRVHSRRRK